MPPAPAHLRTIRVEAAEAEAVDGRILLRVRGVLEDQRPRGIPDFIHHDGDVIHHMEVTLHVSLPDFVIRAVEGRMGTVPYPAVCPAAVPPLQSLVGVSVARGFTRAVNERIGRERGCTHVAALILAMGPVVRQGAVAALDPDGSGRDDARNGGRSDSTGDPDAGGDRPWFVNSCHAWREGGRLHAEWIARRMMADRR